MISYGHRAFTYIVKNENCARWRHFFLWQLIGCLNSTISYDFVPIIICQMQFYTVLQQLCKVSADESVVWSLYDR